MTPDKESERMLQLAHFTIETAVVIKRVVFEKVFCLFKS